MARSIIYFGSNQASPVETWFGQAPSWPDIDRRFVDGIETVGLFGDTKLQNVAAITAVCLSPDTDWDYVLVRFRGSQEWQLLGPGLIARPEGDYVDGFDVKPYFRCPSTRLYDASLLRAAKAGFTGPSAAPNIPLYVPANAPAGWKIGGSGNYELINDTGTLQSVYVWSGKGWSPYGAPVAAGANLKNGANNVTMLGQRGPIASSDRAADYSPDGVWSFLEYYIAGLIRTEGGLPDYGLPAYWLTDQGAPYASAIALPYYDPRGNVGDPSATTTKPYVPSWAGPAALWYAKLGLEVFHDGERTGPAYRPLLAPERVITLPGLTVPTAGAAPQYPTTPIVTVPSFNVDEIQLTLTTPNVQNNLLAAIGSPLPDEGIDVVAQTLTAVAIFAQNSGGAVLRGENVHGYAQIALGGYNGAVDVSYAQLTLRRRFIG